MQNAEKRGRARKLGSTSFGLALVALSFLLGCEGSAESAAVATSSELAAQQTPTSSAVAAPVERVASTGSVAAPPVEDSAPSAASEDRAPKGGPPGPCADGKDNDADGLIDWQYDLGCSGPDDPTEGGLATRHLDEGWSVFEPSADTRIIYVSSSAGKDTYPGTSPKKPKKTLAAALSVAREGHPDWVLLARGDVWHESLYYKEGRSRREPFVIATYGDSATRPLLKTGAGPAIERPGLRYNNFAIVGIAFYAHTRDPDSPEFQGPEGSKGFNFYSKPNKTGKGVLIEDCWFHFYAGNSIQGEGSNEDIVIRRNVFTNSYANGSHAQGLHSKNVSILLEENVFDHNGWYRRAGSPDDKQAGGRGTMYNHNTYSVDQHRTTFRGNIFLRPSSIGNKWTANAGAGSTSDIVIDDNLYVDGEIGISLGGNDKVEPLRFKNITISNNVMLNIGRSRPTNRTLGWCIDVDDWDGGKVTGNLCVNQPDPGLNNVRALAVDGVTRDVRITGNVFHGLHTSKALVVFAGGSDQNGIVFADNRLQGLGDRALLVRSIEALEGYSFQGNAYEIAPGSRPFELEGVRSDFEGWKNVSGETGSERKLAFPEPVRSIEGYQRSIGGPPTIAAFIEGARAQSKLHWRPEYTAHTVNEWIRAGYGR